MSGQWTFRLAVPEDAEAFARWAAGNPLIDPKDLQTGLKKNNPTILFFAVEKDGVVQAFAPLYCPMILAYLGFNPEATSEDKKQAMQTLLDGVSAFAVQFGIREIITLSKEKYPVAQWALAHGFEIDPRQLLKLDLNKIMESAEVPANV